VIETLLSDSPDPGPVTVDDSELPASSKPDQPAPRRRGLGSFSPRLAALVVVIIVLGWAYAPNLRGLYATWDRDPNYSHGFLVIPVALVIAWRRWVETEASAIAPAWWAWVALCGVLVARALCYERGFEWTETATLLPTIACLTLAAGGWPLLRRIWPAIGFLIFLLPLPHSVNSLLAQPLQHVATVGSCALLRLTGLWVVAEGNVILVGGDPLEVAAACNGLSMLMTLAATVAAMTVLVPMATWQRVVLFLSIIPIALISNILRITTTAWCYHRFGSKIGEHYAHDAAGWLMMPVALVLVGLELGLLSWLVVREEAPSGPPDVLLRRRPA
jgi:exosortase